MAAAYLSYKICGFFGSDVLQHILHFSGREEDFKHITSEEAIRSAETSWWTVKVLSQAWWELRERENEAAGKKVDDCVYRSQ